MSNAAPVASSNARLTYTRAELAEMTGLCEKTIANHEVPRGKLQFIRVGTRGKRYLATDLQEWLESLRCDAHQQTKREGHGDE